MTVIIIALCCIILDVVTGCVKALFTTGFNSTLLREGGKHKFGEILAIVFSMFIEHSLKYFNVSIGFDVTYLTCAYIFVMECISIIENIGQLNDKAIPNKLKKLFEKLNKEVE